MGDAHRIRYTDGTTFIVLWVPWGFGTGQIPPPAIEFYTDSGLRRFIYDAMIDGSGE